MISVKMTLNFRLRLCKLLDRSSKKSILLDEERCYMKNGLFKFYFIFILLSIGLFSCENRLSSHERKIMKLERPRKSYRYYSRSSNLC